MSDILNYIEEHPQETKRLIGLNYTELENLIKNAEILHNEKQVLLENKKVRLIKKGGGRQPILSTKESSDIDFSLSPASDDVSSDWYSIWSQRINSKFDFSLLVAIVKRFITF